VKEETMKKVTVSALLALAVGATTLPAQAPNLRPEIRPFAGAMIATGDQRLLFKDAPLFGIQAALEVRPDFHVLGTFGWMPVQSKYLLADNDVNVLDYSVGVEVGMVRPLPGKWEFKPFVGVGTGARRYLYQGARLGNQTCVTGYAALGTEFQLGHAALRLEGRDNLFCYRSPIAGIASQTRNDVGIAFGVAYHVR
jgi:hypothetical protein